MCVCLCLAKGRKKGGGGLLVESEDCCLNDKIKKEGIQLQDNADPTVHIQPV